MMWPHGDMERLRITPKPGLSIARVSRLVRPGWVEGLLTDFLKYIAKTMSHEAGSLPDLVEKLVKNWEIEASFKTSLDDWRTINRKTYTFSLNGGEPQPGEHMLKIGTYNALLTSSPYYDPSHNDFETSHKAFKRMMPTFAWEVSEVYAGPPVVTFKWRHWGYMANDYIGNNEYVVAFAIASPTSDRLLIRNFRQSWGEHKDKGTRRVDRDRGDRNCEGER